MWTISIHDDLQPTSGFSEYYHHQRSFSAGATKPPVGDALRPPLCEDDVDNQDAIVRTYLMECSCLVEEILHSSNGWERSNEEEATTTGSSDETNQPISAMLILSDRCSRVAFADYMCRGFLSHFPSQQNGFSIQENIERSAQSLQDNRLTVFLEPLERNAMFSSSQYSVGTCRRRGFPMNEQKRRRPLSNTSYHSTTLTPYVLERSDFSCSNEGRLKILARIVVNKSVTRSGFYHGGSKATTDATYSAPRATVDSCAENVNDIPAQILDESTQKLERIRSQVNHLLCDWLRRKFDLHRALNHVATAVVQDRLRQQLSSGASGSNNGGKAIAFVANQAILPRKSGATHAPMASPPAVPFLAPVGSRYMHRTLCVEIPRVLACHLPPEIISSTQNDRKNVKDEQTQDVVDSNIISDLCQVSLTGLWIPCGVNLIVGGGYHGKSTLLRTIAAGVYNKVPGDGREFCVTVEDAITIRAEDGRYVNNCNISAFLSNLPRPAGITSSNTDTRHFSTSEASGSTSQAANIMEALELQTTALLIDEDVSAANFMARDGRMRALVMDESITPLLYRVNGLFHAHGVSSIVVVGGVGDWLDVADNVILMKNYSCFDATAKARSISKQFSHGHVQYAGRGVVHRLDWDKTMYTPAPRRPTAASTTPFDRDTTSIGLLDGGNGMNLVFHTTTTSSSWPEHQNIASTHDDEYTVNPYMIDVSRCEQLLGKKPQLYGCGLAVLWVIQASRSNPKLGMSELLDLLDRRMDEKGALSALLGGAGSGREDGCKEGYSGTEDLQIGRLRDVIDVCGFFYRPRRFEVGQAICRLRGISFEELPKFGTNDSSAVEDEDSLCAPEPFVVDEELQNTTNEEVDLVDLWNSRRKTKSFT
ncbi:hypothetical protein ACA910_015568 [Epithemia clementina (nom. ined.)]